MRYASIVENKIVQIQPNQQEGFIEVDDTVTCGMIRNEDGTFSVPPQTAQAVLNIKIREAMKYLDKTDIKVLPYYDFKESDISLEEYVALRSEARQFIRSNKWNI